jgi:hypothetical protein
MSKVDIQHAVDVLSNLAQSEGDVGYEYWMSIIKLLKQPPTVPDGYALVPIEPTPKMCKAAYWAKDKWHSTQCDTQDELYFSFAQPRWKAMLAAAKGQS